MIDDNSLCDVDADPEGDCDGDTILNKDDVCPDNPDTTANQKDTDCDGDGISNFIEDGDFCTDSTKADTDLDGFDDGEELAAGTDPCNAGSHP